MYSAPPPATPQNTVSLRHVGPWTTSRPPSSTKPMRRKSAAPPSARILNDADLKPHKSVYWLNSHDPDFEAKARAICQLYVQAPHFYQQGRLLLCCDEKTGMQILQRNAPTKLMQPGKPEKREFEYTRLGTRTLISSFAVPTGEVVWDLGLTRTSLDFRAHIWRRDSPLPQLRTHRLDRRQSQHALQPGTMRMMAYLNRVPFEVQQLQTMVQRRLFLSNPEHRYVFHYVPLHGSWLNQVELWFRRAEPPIPAPRRLCLREGFEDRLRRRLDQYNLEQAHPYRWTYTGQPLVRATPFSKTRRQERRGRAWLGLALDLDRLLHPPRPYCRRSLQVLANL